MPFRTESGVLPDSKPNALVSFATPAGGSCAECSVAINPTTPSQIIVAVRQVPSTEEFAKSIIVTYYSSDTGATWKKSADLSLRPPAPGQQWGGATDPSIAWDNAGNAYLLTLPVTSDFSELVGIAAYRSTDGGATWGNPVLFHASAEDDKPNILVDNSQPPPRSGRVYAFWNQEIPSGATNICFARSDDKGATWYGLGAGPGASKAGDVIAKASFPSVSISPEGVIYVAFSTYSIAAASFVFRVLRSDNGGDSFVMCTDLVGPQLMSLDHASVTVGVESEGGDHFSNANFRVFAYPVVCAGNNNLVLCAWPTNKGPGGTPRIYYISRWILATAGMDHLPGRLCRVLSQRRREFLPRS